MPCSLIVFVVVVVVVFVLSHYCIRLEEVEGCIRVLQRAKNVPKMLSYKEINNAFCFTKNYALLPALVLF